MNTHHTRSGYYYQIWFDDSNPRAFITSPMDLNGVDRWIVHSARPVERWPDNVTFYGQGEELEDYLFSALPGWILISDDARRTIANCIGTRDVQFLPVTIVDKHSGKQLTPYWLLHVTRTAEALDWERTTWFHPANKYDDQHASLDIVQVALRATALDGLHIFRLKIRDNLRGPYISETLKACLEREQVTTGFKFIPVPAFLE